MIRINLLPFRIARKKENIRKQVSIFFLMILLSAAGLYWYTGLINKQIADYKRKTDNVNHQIAKYKEKANRVLQIKKDLKILDDKLNVVASLKKQRDKQLILFDEMTGLIVPARMWLESLKTTQDHVMIKGIAFDNPTIADFMERLEQSSLFSTVDLKTAQMKQFKNNVMLKSFELLCKKEKSKPEQTKNSKQGKK